MLLYPVSVKVAKKRPYAKCNSDDKAVTWATNLEDFSRAAKSVYISVYSPLPGQLGPLL